MKFTIIKNKRNGAQNIKRMEMSAFFDKIRTDERGRIAALREYMRWNDDAEKYEHADRIARVYPLATLKLSANNDMEMSSYNGIIWLHIDELRHVSEQKAAKEAVAGLPSTLAAFVGADGKSLEVLVAVKPKIGKMPDNEANANDLCLSAHEKVSRIYEVVLQCGEIVRQRITVRSSMMWPNDPEPYVNPDALPITVDSRMLTAVSGPAFSAESVEETMDARARHARMYAQAVRDSGRRLDEMDSIEDCADLLAELAHRLRAMGLEERDAFRQLRLNSLLWSWYDEDNLRDIVAAAYAEDHVKKYPRFADGEAESSRRFERFVQSHYHLRYNVMMLRVEYLSTDAPYGDWQPVDDRVLNTIQRDARNAGLKIHGNDARTYVHSTKIKEYNPVSNYLLMLEWDGKTDYIGMLADTVPCKVPHWKMWFRKWFLGMVAQCQGMTRGHGNQIVPLLISELGYNKTTFCARLLPPELSEFYIDNLQVSDKRQMMMAMHQFVLINLDEFNQISPKLQSGFLKNLITLGSVKVKRPYGKHVEDFPRMASFIASTNEERVLSDPTGSRRFIGVRLTGPIDVRQPINYRQLYAQAMYALRGGEQYWLTHEEEEELMRHNRQFQLQPTVMEFFYGCFEVTDEANGAQWISATDIYEYLRSKVGASLEVSNVSVLGRYLTHMLPESNRKKGKNEMLYLVRNKEK